MHQLGSADQPARPACAHRHTQAALPAPSAPLAHACACRARCRLRVRMCQLAPVHPLAPARLPAGPARLAARPAPPRARLLSSPAPCHDTTACLLTQAALSLATVPHNKIFVLRHKLPAGKPPAIQFLQYNPSLHKPQSQYKIL